MQVNATMIHKYRKREIFFSLIAYASMLFGVLAILFTMRSRWSIPFIILCFLCSLIGRISRKHGHIALASWAAFLFLFNTSTGSLFYLGQFQDQITRLQQQQLILVNQHLLITYQNVILSKQFPLLSAHQQFLSVHASLSQNYKKSLQIWSQNTQYTTDDLKEIKNDLPDLNEFVAYTTYQLQQDSWQLPNSTNVSYNDDTLASNAKEIQTIQDWISTVYQPQIVQNNALLSNAEKIAYQPPLQVQVCPSTYQCALQPWQQSFSIGWHQTILQPLRENWQFWSVLVLSLLLTFIVLPRITRPSSTLTYRILSRKMLSSYPPTSHPFMNLSTLPSSATLLQIGLKRSAQPQPRRKDFQQDQLLFDFTPTITVLGAYMKINGVISNTFHTLSSTNAENASELTHGPQPGTVLFRPQKALFMPQVGWRYRVQLFIATDQPPPTITATATLPDIDHFEQARGTPFLHALYSISNILSLILLYGLCSIPLAGCSVAFFNGLNWNHPFLFSTFFGLIIWGLALYLVLKGMAMILKKSLALPQRIMIPTKLIPAFTEAEMLSQQV